jgi:hypothetical protein
MATVASIVDLVHPTVSGTDVITTDTVWVLFDKEMDQSTVSDNLFITGPDHDIISGPDLLLYQEYEAEGEEDDILASPGLHGVVQGEVTFERINAGDLDTYSGYDYLGAGTNYRTKATITPTYRLTPDTTYYVYLTGDEDSTDSLDTGVSSRTVFDTVKGANLGTGTATYTGGYTGSAAVDTLYAKVTTSGDQSSARYVYWKGSNPTVIQGPYTASTRAMSLSDGVKIAFAEGTYGVNDTFSCVVKERAIFTGNLYWEFQTGSGSIDAVPDEASTSIIGTPSQTTTSGVTATTFSVTDTSPDDQATNLDLQDADTTITVNFSEVIDNTTVSSSTISVISEPVTGEVDSPDVGVTFSGSLPFVAAVSGSVLQITVVSGYIFDNNVVTVKLEDDIKSVYGVALSEDYEFYFSSSYTPMYSSVRKVRLEYGAQLSGVADDTINLAIFEASTLADALVWASASTSSTYFLRARREWTTCKAGEMLLTNMLGIHGGLRAKKLGDMEVQYSQNDLQITLERAINCTQKWLAVLHGGGYAVQTPTIAVKGEYDIDRPPIGRGWGRTSGGVPIANAKRRQNLARRWKSGEKGLMRSGLWDKDEL